MAERCSARIFLTPEHLRRALRQRSITDAEIDSVVIALRDPDPAGLVQPPGREEVAHVAAYLHRRIGGAWIASPFWRLIERGHPAARAIRWHEVQELESYSLLGVQNPLRVRSGGVLYWRAPARASWHEARYWETWAAPHPLVLALRRARQFYQEKQLTPRDIERWLSR